MDYSKLQGAAADFDSADTIINEQNARFELSQNISDEQFRVIAVGGLAVEQQASIVHRSEVVKDIDYAEIFNEWDVIHTEKTSITNNIDQTRADIDNITEQAKLSKEVAPSLEDQIQILADEKISILQNKIVESEKSLSDLDTKELGFIAICMPWTIPKVIDPTEQSFATESASQPAETIATHERPETLEAPILANEKLDSIDREADLKKVLWAVYDAVEKAGKTGVRIEEMRREVPELMDLNTEDYKYFKHNFAKMRNHIVTMMDRMNIVVTWGETGKTRGTRYFVTTREKPLNLPPDTRIMNQEADTETSTNTPQIIDETPEPSELEIVDSISVSKTSEDETIATESSHNTELLESIPDTAKDQELDVEEPIVSVAKNPSRSGLGGTCDVANVPMSEVAKHIGIKKDPQLIAQVEKWISWLIENPRSSASRKIRSFKGLRLAGGVQPVPLFRLSPKDAQGLTVPRAYLRQRVVYAIVNEVPIIVDVLDHDAFDRRYQ